jgi:hypothetical protein
MGFIRQVFSEPGSDGTGSFGRLAAGVSLVAVICWVTRIVLKTNAIPDLLNCFYLVGGLYGLNKLPEILDKLVQLRTGALKPPS